MLSRQCISLFVLLLLYTDYSMILFVCCFALLFVCSSPNENVATLTLHVSVGKGLRIPPVTCMHRKLGHPTISPRSKAGRVAAVECSE